MATTKKIKKLLTSELRTLLSKTEVKNNSFIYFHEELDQQILKIYRISKQYNESFLSYITNIEDFKALIIDYFFYKGKYDAEAKQKVEFKNSPFYDDFADHIKAIIKIIKDIPYEYSYIIPLSISDKRLKGINIKLTDNFFLRAMEIEPSLTYQYLVSVDQSGYYIPLSSPKEGNRLCFYGTYRGYIPRLYWKNQSEAGIINYLEECLALLSFTGIFEQKSSILNTSLNLSIYYFKGDQYKTTSILPIQLSSWVNKFILSETVYDQDPLSLLVFPDSDKTKLKPLEVLERKVQILKDYMEIRESKMNNLRDFKRFNSALHWYLEALIAENKTIRFVDLYIVLEALVGSSDPKLTKHIEIPERTALLIGSTIKEREHIIEIVTDANNRRNSFVHEGEVLSTHEDSLLSELHTITHAAMHTQLMYLRKSWLKNK
jgi:hypothetical protein